MQKGGKIVGFAYVRGMTKTRVFMAIFLAVAATLLISAPANAWQPSTGTVYGLDLYHSRKCMEIPNGSSGGAAVDQWTCVNQPNMRWYFDRAGTIGGRTWWRIRNAQSGLCMTAYGSAQGSVVVQAACSSSPEGRFTVWTQSPAGTSYVWIEAASGLVLTVENASRDNGGRVVQSARCSCAHQYVGAFVWID